MSLCESNTHTPFHHSIKLHKRLQGAVERLDASISRRTSLATETVEGSALTLEGVDDVCIIIIC